MTGLDSVIDAVNMSLGKLPKTLEDRRACCAVVHRVVKSRTQLSNYNNNNNKNIVDALNDDQRLKSLCSYSGNVIQFANEECDCDMNWPSHIIMTRLSLYCLLLIAC